MQAPTVIAAPPMMTAASYMPAATSYMPAATSYMPAATSYQPAAPRGGLFDMIDRNHDGKISRSELSAAFRGY
eukprot:1234253-Amphidinium_carterae.1